MKSKFYTTIVSLIAYATLVLGAGNGEQSVFIIPDKDKRIVPILAMEGWSLSSLGTATGTEDYINRGDILFRRFRLGAKGNPYPWFKYSFQLNLDRFGEGAYTPIKGNYKGIDVWNAYITIKILKQNEWLHLHAGHYWAAVSREYNTSPWAVASLDKVRADWFLRKFVSGEGNGIINGIGLGGLKNSDKIGLSYRLGVYEPNAFSASQKTGNLFTGRLMLTIGDSEQKKYQYMLSGNQWRKRKGITLGFGASTLNNACIHDTINLTESVSVGSDLLINYDGLRIDMAYYKMSRKAEAYNRFNGAQWHIRCAYSLVLFQKYLEPVLSFDQYNGNGNKTLYSFIGYDKSFDMGINWYMNKDKLKLALHYLKQESDFSKSRDYVALAFQFRL